MFNPLRRHLLSGAAAPPTLRMVVLVSMSLVSLHLFYIWRPPARFDEKTSMWVIAPTPPLLSLVTASPPAPAPAARWWPCRHRQQLQQLQHRQT